ncbi:transporter substrate-binding domain-containing protein [Vibrio sp. S4M6]|uniref:substrate-binding periplasmic protein n=1 Tax=Vibrio sinus TaxID=2946865 RepID=UPI00202A7E6E|nr:transporter substrate-binding domain-containing protein [Vibrio sinus]MCL9782702.1 transporter substrate-binding domain-containing protein [Vibrio sinus]
MQKVGMLFLTLMLTTLSLSIGSEPLPSSDPWGQVAFVTEEYPPHNYVDDQGQLTGLSVEVILGAAKLAGSKLSRDHIVVLPWARGYKMALNMEDTLLFTTSRKPERETLFEWIGPLSKGSPSVLFARKTSQIKIKAPSDLLNYRIGVVRGDSLQKRLVSLGVPESALVKSHSPEELAKQLNRHDIDLWAYNPSGAEKIFQKFGLANNNFEHVYQFKFNDNYIAANKHTSRAVIINIQQALDKFKKTKEYKNILSKYQ